MSARNGNGMEPGNGHGGEPLNPTARARAWFCVRTRQKSEHIAAAHLRELPEIDVFNPRIKFKRPRGKHKMWVTEALFPGYVFAKFNWREHLKLVHYTNGVTGVVHFGEQWPIIDDTVIVEWQAALGEEELALCEEMPQPGSPPALSKGCSRKWFACRAPSGGSPCSWSFLVSRFNSSSRRINSPAPTSARRFPFLSPPERSWSGREENWGTRWSGAM
jgi:hypothetical protein